MHKPYPGEPVLAEHDHDWADGFCQDPDCAALLIDEVEHEVICSLDFGQRTIEETYIDPISRLSFEMRSRTTCDNCRALLIRLAEEDVAELSRTEWGGDWLETATSILEAWEARAGDYGLIGYADEGTYWIAAQR